MYMTENRIGRILKELRLYTRSAEACIDSFKMVEGNYKYEDCPKLDDSAWKPFSKNDRWGGRDKHCWFTADFIVPEGMDGKVLALAVATGREDGWDATNPQFIAYINGSLVQGLDVNHREVILTHNARKGESYQIHLDAYSGMIEGLICLNCCVCAVEKESEKLYYDIEVPYSIAVLLDKDDKRRIDIFQFLSEAVNLIDFRKPFSEEFRKSIAEAAEYLDSKFYKGYCGHNGITAHCVGHTHIDVAWLWTIAQTREKAARSFSTVLNLMNEYPEYVFMSSQPQLYKFVKTDYPGLYEKIKQRIEEGRWEPEGAMWLEADCNLASGEALVRQLLFGTRFFENEFNVKNRILWLPDVFGYSAALPQLLKKSGIDYFVTTKISWNEYNKIPYDTFMWRGIDGTEILTQFITTQDYITDRFITTYNGNLIPTQVMGAWKRYQQKDLTNEVLISYGFGDGGGGPTREMLENARRMEKGIPGCPKVRLGRALDYLERLDAKASAGKKTPKWVGELYLEYHRGTYTSMARNKKYNRKSELLYQAAEIFSVADCLLNSSVYPEEKLNNGWEKILLNQFHDILPGSSIREVYEDSKEQYLEILRNGRQILDDSIGAIAGSIDLDSPSIVVFNPIGFDRNDIVEIKLPDGFENAECFDDGGAMMPSQISENGNLMFYAAGVPTNGYKAFRIKKAGDASGSNRKINDTDGTHSLDAAVNYHCSDNVEAGLNLDAAQLFDSYRCIENKYFKIIFDENMNIASLYDKSNCREVVKSGEKANVLQAFEDKPHNFDAWDINIYYQEKMWEVNDVQSAAIVETGSIRTAVRISRKFCDSYITQDISIYNDIPRIDFKTSIDWKETQVLLKAAFPTDIHSDRASYDIQFGNVERPTHWNTSWDQAKFEVCAHKWADLSEDGYGISLLNDCKYGHDIKDGVMRLTLIKSAKDPNESADRELHQFTYSLYPHCGGFRDAGTVAMAYALNCPLYAKYEGEHTGKLPMVFSIAGTNKENVIIEAVKKAEDSDDIIIRLYECYNRRTTVRLTFGSKILDAWECDLMENNQLRLEHNGNSLEFVIKPYEIKTIKLRVK